MSVIKFFTLRKPKKSRNKMFKIKKEKDCIITKFFKN